MKQQEINKLLDEYRKGTISPENRRLLEQLSIEDDFVFDAMQGMTVEVNSSATSKDLDGLRERLKSRVSTQKKISWWIPGAAAAILLVIAGLWLFQDSGVSNGVYAALPKEESAEKRKEVDIDRQEQVFQNVKVGDQNNSGTTVAQMEEQEEIQAVVQETSVGFTKDRSGSNSSIVTDGESVDSEPIATVESREEAVNQAGFEKSYALDQVSENKNSSEDVAFSDAGLEDDSFQGDLNTEYSPERNATSEDVAVSSTQSAPAKVKAKKEAPEEEASIFYNGRVLDTNGYPIIGATVSIVGMRRTGFTTDIDGNVEITGVDIENPRAVISYTGFNTVEIPVTEGFQVILQEGAVLSEVVVTSAGKDSRSGLASPVVGWDEFNETLANRVNRTLGSASAGIEIRFRVTKNGVPRGFKIVKGKGKPEAQAVIDLIKAEEWTEGRGKVVFN